MHELLALRTTGTIAHAIDLHAGDGRRIHELCQKFGSIAQANTWAICATPDEAEQAKAIVGHAICSDVSGTRLCDGGASLAICQSNSLAEILVATSSLVEGGVILCVINDKTSLISDSFGTDKNAIIRHLTGWFTQVYVVKGLNVVAGVKREAYSNGHVAWRLDEWRQEQAIGKYVLPPALGFARGFTKARPTQAEIRAAVIGLEVLEEAKADEVASPIMPLSPGHLGMVLASGMLDGLIMLANGETVVIRGIAEKERYQVSQEVSESDGGVRTRKTVLSERAILKIRTIDQAGVIVQYVTQE